MSRARKGLYEAQASQVHAFKVIFGRYRGGQANRWGASLRCVHAVSYNCTDEHAER